MINDNRISICENTYNIIMIKIFYEYVIYVISQNYNNILVLAIFEYFIINTL
jgi:hypothetical protein